MTSGIGGWLRGPYQRGRTRKASRSSPLWARYGKPRIFTSPGGPVSGTGMAAAAGSATRLAAAATATALCRLPKGVVWSGRGLAASQSGRTGDDADEGEHPQRAERAVRKPLVEERCPGHDRQRIRQQRRHPGGRERGAALEAELECDEG